MGMVGHGVAISFLLDTIVTKYPEVVGKPLSKPLLLEAGLACPCRRVGLEMRFPHLPTLSKMIRPSRTGLDAQVLQPRRINAKL